MIKTATSILALGLAMSLGGCGVVYHSSSLKSVTAEKETVRVVKISAESAMIANRMPYTPRALPAAFSQTSGTYGSGPGPTAPPASVYDQTGRMPLELRLPPEPPVEPYRIGISDVVRIATPSPRNTVEELSGLLAAQNARQGYTVQDDGSINIAGVGRVQLAGLTLEEAEAELFQRLVANQIDPTFSLEISNFNSRKVTVGGAVRSSGVIPIALTPLYLEQALAEAGGLNVADEDYASIRIYRDGALYQIPLRDLYANDDLLRVRLVEGDVLYVDTAYDLEMARSYFQEQISLAGFRRTERQAALSRLNTEIGMRRAQLNEQRSLYQTRLNLGAEKRDYVYLVGEVRTPSRYTLPFEQSATLADALYSNAGGLSRITGDVRQVYVLRGSADPREFGAITAWQLDLSNAANYLLATRFELRPQDVIFIAEQPVTRWNRTIGQIVPTLNLAARTENLTN